MSREIVTTVDDISLNNQSWTSPCVFAVRIKIPWRCMETSRGVYDFSILDAGLAFAAEYGKQLVLTVGVGYTTPQWVYDEGAQSWTAISGPHMGTMPLPWDTTYLQLFKEFVITLAAHCDSNPTLSYIQIQGFGQSGELYCAQSEPDNQNLIDLGGIPAWSDAAHQIVAFHRYNFKQTPVYVALAKPFMGTEGALAEQDFVQWFKATYPSRVGLMCNSLSCRSSVSFYPNEAVATYKPSGFQMVCSATTEPERMGGTLGQAIDSGIAIGGQFIEVYYLDVQNPVNQTMLASKNDQLRL